ncbi:dynein regulatory complex subunit 2 isoform X3 [Malaclemys terrapin pileata]|nr:dynein regulatory complex subunit 2 isoform X3 [Malaclemys terrapin pileata]
MREAEEQNRRVHEEKEVVLKQLQKLKSQMNQARAKARSNLAKLTLESSTALKKLRGVLEKVKAGVPLTLQERPLPRPRGPALPCMPGVALAKCSSPLPLSRTGSREKSQPCSLAGGRLASPKPIIPSWPQGDTSPAVPLRCPHNPAPPRKSVPSWCPEHTAHRAVPKRPAKASLAPQAELTLRLAEMCRKLETEEEKVLPFYASSLSREEQEELEQVSLEKPGEQLAQVRGETRTPSPPIRVLEGGRRGCLEAGWHSWWSMCRTGRLGRRLLRTKRSLIEGTSRTRWGALWEPPLSSPLSFQVQLMQDYLGLEHFWQRYNKVKLEQLALEREKAVLRQENQKLRLLLKQYLDGISVSDEVLSRLNPLLILNPKPRAPGPAGRAHRKPPLHNVIEAAHEVPHIL